MGGGVSGWRCECVGDVWLVRGVARGMLSLGCMQHDSIISMDHVS